MTEVFTGYIPSAEQVADLVLSCARVATKPISDIDPVFGKIIDDCLSHQLTSDEFKERLVVYLPPGERRKLQATAAPTDNADADAG